VPYGTVQSICSFVLLTRLVAWAIGMQVRMKANDALVAINKAVVTVGLPNVLRA
jgi:hypothetical protein